jgi:exodeoxyribonuclease VII small subunit
VAKKAFKPEDPVPPLDFEQAMAQLEAIVRDLEGGELGLSESLSRYEQGVTLLRQSHELLERAERRIELLSGVDSEGRPVCVPLDDTSLTLEEKAQRRSHRRSAAEPPPAGAEGVGSTYPEVDGGEDFH